MWSLFIATNDEEVIDQLSESYSVERISSITGLTSDEIKGL